MVIPASLAEPASAQPRTLVAADGLALAAEAFDGLGPGVLLAHGFGQTRQAWAAILVACALGLAFYLAVAGLERLLAPWRTERERWSPASTS